MTITKIRCLRESKKWNQEELAAKMGITQNTYSRIESGQSRLTIERLHQLANIFEVTADYLINNQAPITKNNNDSNHIATIYTQIHIEAHKELLNELLKSKNDQIKQLNETIESLKKDKERLLQIIENSKH
jgi:transcriptional regulator with XRE-family HTH domain